MRKDNKPLISVCMLCYNHEKYVAQAIQSVLDQTYDNWELIVTDNVSTDSSRKIIENYEKKDKRIKASFLDFNSYPSEGVNNSIKYASGDYIAILSADDYFVPEKLENQLNYMLSQGLSNSFTWVNIINDEGEELIEHYLDKLFNKNYKNKLDLMRMLVHQNVLCAVTGMFHKSIFGKYGYFDNRLLQTQDFDLWLRIIKCEQINLLTEKLTCYRVRDDGHNLSLNINLSGQIRCVTEQIWYMQHICDIDADTISQLIGKPCNEVSKYKELFYFYMKQENKPIATAVLMSMYNKLGSNFSFPSQLYNDFLEVYSQLDIFGNFSHLTNAITELSYDNGSGFSESNILDNPIVTSGKNYTFDISFIKNVQKIRFSLTNQLAKIGLVKTVLIDNNDEKTVIYPVLHNPNNVIDDLYDFLNYENSQIIYNIPDRLINDLSKVDFELSIQPYSKYELFSFCRDKNFLKRENQSLHTEINRIYSSMSWKITRPFRFISTLICKYIKKLS